MIASACDFCINLASFRLQKPTKIASWKRHGASGARLGGLLERLGRVLERLGLMWERPVGVLVRLGAYGARMERVFKRLGYVRMKLCYHPGAVGAGSGEVRSSGGPRGSPIIKTKETLRRKPYTEKHLQRVSV